MALVIRSIAHTDISAQWRLGRWGDYRIKGEGKVYLPVLAGSAAYFPNGVVESSLFLWQKSAGELRNELTAGLVELLDKWLRFQHDQTDPGCVLVRDTPAPSNRNALHGGLREMTIPGGLRAAVIDGRLRFLRNGVDATDSLANILNTGLYLELLRVLSEIEDASPDSVPEGGWPGC